MINLHYLRMMVVRAFPSWYDRGCRRLLSYANSKQPETIQMICNRYSTCYAETAHLSRLIKLFKAKPGAQDIT